MSEPTDPREIRHDARMKKIHDEQGNVTGMHTFGLNPVTPSENGVHIHHLTTSGNPSLQPSELPQHDYGASRFQEDVEKFPGLTAQQIGSDARLMQSLSIPDDIAQQLFNMDPKTVRENHMRLTMPRTPYDRDQDRQLRAQAALNRCTVSARAKMCVVDRCLSIIKSLEHMEVDKDIALIALEALSEGQE